MVRRSKRIYTKSTKFACNSKNLNQSNFNRNNSVRSTIRKFYVSSKLKTNATFPILFYRAATRGTRDVKLNRGLLCFLFVSAVGKHLEESALRIPHYPPRRNTRFTAARGRAALRLGESGWRSNNKHGITN